MLFLPYVILLLTVFGYQAFLRFLWTLSLMHTFFGGTLELLTFSNVNHHSFARIYCTDDIVMIVTECYLYTFYVCILGLFTYWNVNHHSAYLL